MKKSTFNSLWLALAFVAFCCCSCSTTKIASSDLQQLKNQKPADGKALVYFVRPNAFGGAIGFKVSCDGNHIGTTTGKRFIYTQLEPGTHSFLSKAENKAELYLEVEAGETYFIEQKVKMGIAIARNQLERLSDAEGRAALRKCKLSGDCPAYKSSN